MGNKSKIITVHLNIAQLHRRTIEDYVKKAEEKGATELEFIFGRIGSTRVAFTILLKSE